MTDQDLIAKKLTLIETCMCDLRQQARPDRLSADVRELRFVEHTLQIAIHIGRFAGPRVERSSPSPHCDADV